MDTPQLQEAVDKVTAGVPFRDLRQAAHRLTTAYRAMRHLGTGELSRLDALAYAATRMPATCAAVRSVLREFDARCPELGLEVSSVLDLGAGSGTGAWAAGLECSTLRSVTCVERDREMAELGQRLFEHASFVSSVEATWCLEPLLAQTRYVSHDLVLVAYVLGELDDGARTRVVEAAWDATDVAFVAVLPGSTDGYRTMLEVREQLQSLGARVVAPCPHDRPCPLFDTPDADWCHFATRVSRSSLHRRLKDGRLPYEDEKFTYVVGTRDQGARARGRVIRRPVFGPRQVVLTVCGHDGIVRERVPRSRREVYRRARKIGWGDPWPSVEPDTSS